MTSNAVMKNTRTVIWDIDTGGAPERLLFGSLASEESKP